MGAAVQSCASGSRDPSGRSASDTQALTNLRRELHHLREGWPALDALVDAESRTLAWDVDGAIVDLVAFEAAADRGLAGDRVALQEAACLYKGDVLPDYGGEWIDGDRERLHQRARDVLARLVALLETGASLRRCDRACAAAPSI